MLDQQTDTTAATSVVEAPPSEDQAPATEAQAPDTEAQADRSGDGASRRRFETQVVVDDLDGMSLEDAIDATIVAFDDGDLVTGKVVKIDSDEVLLDIGYKSEGVIPSKELSIRNDVDPHEVVSLGERDRSARPHQRRTRTAA